MHTWACVWVQLRSAEQRAARLEVQGTVADACRPCSNAESIPRDLKCTCACTLSVADLPSAPGLTIHRSCTLKVSP